MYRDLFGIHVEGARNIPYEELGMFRKYLPKDKFLPVVTKGWEALVASVDTEGKVCWVQPVGQAPKRIEKRMTQVYGTGGFLMAACEMYKLTE